MAPKGITIVGLAFVGIFLAPTIARGQIRTDGTLGSAQTLSGPNFAIPASLGRQAGANLFHSFAQFGVPTGGSATFSGPTSVANIISRVTGVDPSRIDGRLASSIGGANLFLINPKGIAFGRNASLDLSGSFYASTANYLKFADGSRFEATATANPVLTSAPPAAFGFLGPSAAPISAQGAVLAPVEGVSISLVGGPVRLTNSVLYSTAGDVRIAGVGGTGEVSLAGVPTPSLSRVPVTLEGGGVVAESTLSKAPGRIVIRGGALKFIDTSVISNNFSPGAAPPIELVGSGDVLFSGGQLSSITQRPGRGADIVARGKNVTIDRAAWVQATTLGRGRAGDVDLGARSTLLVAEAPTDPDRTIVAAQTESSGNGGDLRLSGDTVRIDGAYVRNRTFRSGNNGTLVIEGRNVEIVGGASVAAETTPASTGSSGGIRVRATERILVAGHNSFGEQTYFFTSTDGTGQGGSMLLQAPYVRVSGAIVDTVTEGTGKGAPLTIEAETVLLEASGPFTAVISSLSGSAATGQAGTLTVRASRSLTMGGVGIFTKAHAYQPVTLLTQNVGAGLGGDIVVESPQIALDTGWILAESYGAGDLGNVTVRTHDLSMLRDAAVRSTRAPSATGRSGSVRIEGTGSLTLGSRTATGTSPTRAQGGTASILTTDSGNTPAGNITIDMAEVYIGPNSSITTAGFGAGGSGSITIGAQRMKVANGLILSQTGSLGVPTANPGRAGSITLNVGESLEMSTLGAIPTSAGGVLSSGATGLGAAGDIRVVAPSILLDGFLIQAATLGAGQGGRVDVRADNLLLRNGAQVSSGTEPGSTGSAGALNVDVAGRLEISGARLDGISSGLTATTRGAGEGGDISVKANSLVIDGRGFVIASTQGDGRAGSIDIQANDILLTNGSAIRARSLSTGAAGSIRIGASDALRLFGGSEIDTQALASDGGNIDIRAGNRVHLRDSEISTAVGSGQGAGGNIFIDPTFVILENSRIVANAFGGPGGNIRIIADYFLSSPGSLVDASSRLGTSGSVQIAALNTDLDSELASLPTQVLDASAMLRESCTARLAKGRGSSSLVGVGRGGLAASPERFAAASYFWSEGAPDPTAATVPSSTGLKLVATLRARQIARCGNG